MSMYPIFTIPITAGSGNVTITGIPQTFTHLQLRVSVVGSQNGYSSYVRFNGDSGNNYSYHYLNGNGTSVTAAGVASTSFIGLTGVTDGYGSSAPYVAIMDILNYTNTSVNKVTRGIGGIDKNGGGEVDTHSGCWYNTSAITSLSVVLNGGTLASGNYSLYGISTSNATGA